MLKAIIAGADFIYMSRFVSDEETRYYLKGVNVEAGADGGAVLASTNGSILGAMRLAKDEARFTAGAPSFILASSKELLRAVKCAKREQSWLICRDDRIDVVKLNSTPADVAELESAPVTCSFPAGACYIDGTFPDWRRVMPEPKAAPREGSFKTGVKYSVALNPELLALFAGAGDARGVAFDWNGDGPILVANVDPRFIGVIMPIRLGATLEEIGERRAMFFPTPAAAPAEIAESIAAE